MYIRVNVCSVSVLKVKLMYVVTLRSVHVDIVLIFVLG